MWTELENWMSLKNKKRENTTSVENHNLKAWKHFYFWSHNVKEEMSQDFPGYIFYFLFAIS